MAGKERFCQGVEDTPWQKHLPTHGTALLLGDNKHNRRENFKQLSERKFSDFLEKVPITCETRIFFKLSQIIGHISVFYRHQRQLSQICNLHDSPCKTERPAGYHPSRIARVP